ncbi:chaperone modulator CbpM [Parvicella tangerina]|uniref:Chaperone modulatory protein CbpM n=1 Tax=Parvicella tangerina TaxID=2829795 RepID=A0A916JQ97_9FLAO|nr:chaperone modulator CbpM [Parvicella tangerina]CAG5085658.1 Chaperone modulatory protein CbpM [Parvicella tangerina]
MESKTLIAIEEICSGHKVERTLILTMEEYGLIEVVKEGYVESSYLPRIEKIIRFHSDLDINFEGIDVILNLLDRMDEMNEELIVLRNKLSGFEE